MLSMVKSGWAQSVGKALKFTVTQKLTDGVN